MNKVVPALLLVVAVSACEKSEPAPSATPPAKSAAAPAAKPNLDLQPTHPFPAEYTIAIEKSATEPPTYSVVWTAKVDSSGWKITTESVLVEDDGLGKTVARVYTILHEPQPGDRITATPEVLTARYDAGEKIVEKAELSAKHTVRDSKPTYPQLYVIVKRAGG